MVKNLLVMQETWVWSLGWEDPLEKGMATHSSFLAWEFYGQRNLGGLQPMGSQRVRHDWVTDTFTLLFHKSKEGLHRLSGKKFACQCRGCEFDPWVRKIPWRRKWQPTPVFLPGKFYGQRRLAGYSPRGRKESDTTKWLTLFIFNFIYEKKELKE